MALADIIRSAVAVADRVTKSVQVPVLHASWLGTFSESGLPARGSPVVRLGIAEKKQRLVRNNKGQDVMTAHYIAFVGPVTVTVHDEFILPDGSTGPVLNFTGMFDSGGAFPNTGKGTYTTEVYLG